MAPVLARPPPPPRHFYGDHCPTEPGRKRLPDQQLFPHAFAALFFLPLLPPPLQL
jgi:hypothetical protein